ncbi:MAG: cytochrome ubiquinol oxidase subunit I [Solirubrobacterales bacterium]|nr:cytochrome ubiquinol oxidase subunit I [Solirubrobacterales bacterium]
MVFELLAQTFGPVQQEYLLEARQMQALSFVAHIPLVCFGVAFPALVVFTEWRHHRTGDPVYRVLARRWSKIMLALFAVGVVSGTILSFELGLLWPGFMATFGDVFGLGFTLEGFSFFIEAIFIAIYVYGWDRLPPKVHLATGIPVIVTGLTGSFFVIAVNAWMNNPSGFTLDADGQAVDVDPWGALFGNEYLAHELTHMYVAAYIVCGFLIAAVYGWRWLKGHRGRYERKALTIALTAAAIATPVQMIVGDWAARTVAEEQPIKLAAFEDLQETTKGAPFTIPPGIEVPKMLSLLAFHDPNATVTGLDSVPADDRPPVGVVRSSFLIMVAAGMLLLAVAAWFLYFRVRHRRLPETPWFWRAVVASGPLAVIALIAGWVTTEVGRQPWVVYDFMRTEEAVTGAGGIPIGYATLAIVYASVLVAVIWVLRRLAAHPIEEDLETVPEARADG